jgi:hypothetical protein
MLCLAEHRHQFPHSASTSNIVENCASNTVENDIEYVNLEIILRDFWIDILRGRKASKSSGFKRSRLGWARKHPSNVDANHNVPYCFTDAFPSDPLIRNLVRNFGFPFFDFPGDLRFPIKPILALLAHFHSYDI